MFLDNTFPFTHITMEECMAEQGAIQAIVQKVCPDGIHGPYAVARAEHLGLVTFALSQPVWTEDSHPEEGEYVILTKLRKKRAGWKAMHARRIQPSDECKARSTEQ